MAVGVIAGASVTVAAIMLFASPTHDIPDLIGRGDAIRLAVALIAGVIVSVTDIREHRIPNVVTLPTAAALVGSAAVESLVGGPGAPPAHELALAQFAPLLMCAFGMLAAGAVFLALAWFGTLGLGDVKLAAVLGASMLPAFGWVTLVTAFVAAYVVALPHATALLILRRRQGRPGGELAFGPYLVAGAAIAVALAIAGIAG